MEKFKQNMSEEDKQKKKEYMKEHKNNYSTNC